MIDRRRRFRQAGFSLLESVASVFVLAVALLALVPLWSDIQSKQRLVAKIDRASRLAADELERAHAGVLLAGHWQVTEPAGQFAIDAERFPDSGGTRWRIRVTFHERGREHEVVYESLVP